jgi:hypothetical protein
MLFKSRLYLHNKQKKGLPIRGVRKAVGIGTNGLLEGAAGRHQPDPPTIAPPLILPKWEI